MKVFTVGEIARISNPKHFYAGRKVRVLSRDQWGERVWCKVEMLDCPGLTDRVRAEHLSKAA